MEISKSNKSSIVTPRYLVVLAVPMMVWFLSLSSYTTNYKDAIREKLAISQKVRKIMPGNSWDSYVINVRSASLPLAPRTKLRITQHVSPTCPQGPINAKKYSRARVPSIALTSFPRSGKLS